MRDFASCFSDHAVKVSDSSCSGSSSGGATSSSAAAGGADPSSVQSSITSLYRARLAATHKDLLIKVTWSKSHAGPALSVGVDDDPSHHHWKPGAVPSQLLRKKKGTRSYLSGDSVVGLHWDVSAASYGSGPEPLGGFYLVVIVDAEFGLLLGDSSRDFIKRFDASMPVAESSLVSRREQILGHTLYSTRARFVDGGKDHEILIRCKGDGWDAKDSELSVSIDRKRVVQVRRLRWNFRGNQTVFVDGSPVDMMWDVHGWWFGSPPGYAVFMFRRRSALESRLWLEEEMLHKERGISGFSLLIQAFKSP